MAKSKNRKMFISGIEGEIAIAVEDGIVAFCNCKN
jgi:hypothetical protein